MPRRVLILLGLLLLGVVTLGLIFIVGMRTRTPAVVDTQRKINRALFNPRQLRSAGQPGAYAAVVHHVGRRSGTAYRTPVGAVPTEDGFVIALVYGAERSDWLKNVIAAESATIEHEGRTYEVDRPEVLPIEAGDDYFSESDLRAHRLVGVTECLRVRRVES